MWYFGVLGVFRDCIGKVLRLTVKRRCRVWVVSLLLEGIGEGAVWDGVSAGCWLGLGGAMGAELGDFGCTRTMQFEPCPSVF